MTANPTFSKASPSSLTIARRVGVSELNAEREIRGIWVKEFYSWGTFDDPHGWYPPNISVVECPHLAQTAQDLFSQFEQTALTLLKAIALYLGLEETFFEDKVGHGNSLFRAIHYPPILTTPSGSIRAAQHEDINLITILVGASAEGLEVLNNDGHWIPVKSLENELVINVGDMLQRLTNKKLRSTTHRVVLPYDKALWKQPRYSMPFFTHPRQDVSLKCLDACVTCDNPVKYQDITAGEFLKQRLREIGLIKE